MMSLLYKETYGMCWTGCAHNCVQFGSVQLNWIGDIARGSGINIIDLS